MNKLLAGLAVFQKGAMVADPTTWKNWQMAVNVVVGFLVAAALFAESMGWLQRGTTAEAADIIMGLLVAVAGANVAGTAATSKKVGTGRKPPMPEPPDADELHEPADPVQPRPVSDAARDRADAGRKAFGVD